MKDFFDKVIGYDEIKIELKRICDIMRNPEKYKKLGVTTPRGLLIYGEPGLGKTLMAKCFIEASGRPVHVCRKNKTNGEFVAEIGEVFKAAAQDEPSIVFLDDMDKFANCDRFHRNSDEFVSIQTNIDEVKEKEVFVLATANDIDNLPDSLLRAGRFDKVIEVTSPGGTEAEKIVEYYVGKKNFVAEVDTVELAHILEGKSCAELETVINEAGVLAGFEGKEKIDMDDMIKACMRVIYKAPLSLSPHNDIKSIAYHEAGHTVIAELLEAGSISLVSVCRSNGETGGFTAYNRADDYFMHKKYMENRVLSLLGGRAATEIVFDEVDVGATNDLHRAFDIVTRFVDDYCSFGFDNFVLNSDESSDALLERKGHAIYAEMERYYQLSKKLLLSNRGFLDKVAAALVDKKVLSGKEVRNIKQTCNIVL